MKDVEDLSEFASKDSKPSEDGDSEEITKESIGKEVISVIINVLICFAIVFLITHFVGQRTVVSGSSMEDTLSDGDNLIVDKISYRFHDPERFDVVVFPYQYEEDTYYIKRIIGLPGEVVRIDIDGTIYINDKPLEENYGTEVILNSGLASNEILLGTDEYFVLGDNRNNSTDSRFEAVGNIHGDDIVGKAWVRVYPFNNFGLVDNIE
ncbi:signal peptidase I [Pseudobutyrivibrio sp. OR37]|uniref:signal peptidase I n=1 Tax=Pseudobutyrivibrio sp. OR37 TaxID=1798186 RepID=UPI000B87C282